VHTRLVTCDAAGSWISWGFSFLTCASSTPDVGVRMGKDDAASQRTRPSVMRADAGSLSVLRLSMITRSPVGGSSGAGGVGCTLADSCVMSSGVMFAAAGGVLAVPYAGIASLSSCFCDMVCFV
jgi:hypothetical protein